MSRKLPRINDAPDAQVFYNLHKLFFIDNISDTIRQQNFLNEYRQGVYRQLLMHFQLRTITGLLFAVTFICINEC